MQLVDTHCHIHSRDFPLDITEVEARAANAHVAQLICVGTDVADSKLAVAFVKDKPNAWASIGLHPHDAKVGGASLEELRTIILRAEQKIVAIGECGLDYFYNNSPKADQQKVLRYQIELALEHNLPLIFHVRDAFDDFWPILDSYKGIRGVIHSFTDTQLHLKEIIERNLLVGINGIITFTKNDWQLEVAKAIPLQNMLLETDAPFLTPKPYRGKVNEPAHVMLVAEFLSELRGESVQNIAEATTHNARQLFSLPND